jgi:DNA polymerase sigma
VYNGSNQKIVDSESEDDLEVDFNFNLIKQNDSKEQEYGNKIRTLMKLVEEKEKKLSLNKNQKSTPPWVKERTKENIGLIKLHYEIIDFYNFIKPTDSENNLRVKTFSLFENLIKNRWPQWRIELFGSFAKNIHLPDSDIDVVVLKYSADSSPQSLFYSSQDSYLSESKQLDLIYFEILNKKFADEIRMVDAKVPIIKMRCRQTGVRMDIS